MKIESGNNVGAAHTGGGAKTAAPGFAPAAEAPQRAAAATPVSAVSAADAVLALQTEEPPAQRRARQAKRGGAALDALDRLKAGLLAGWAPGALKSELERLKAGGELTGEAGLDAILREIDTRLAVELAKLDVLAASA